MRGAIFATGKRHSLPGTLTPAGGVGQRPEVWKSEGNDLIELRSRRQTTWMIQRAFLAYVLHSVNFELFLRPVRSQTRHVEGDGCPGGAGTAGCGGKRRAAGRRKLSLLFASQPHAGRFVDEEGHPRR